MGAFAIDELFSGKAIVETLTCVSGSLCTRREFRTHAHARETRARAGCNFRAQRRAPHGLARPRQARGV